MAKIYLGECQFRDCIEGMKELKDKSFDLGFADPPFNINLEKNVNGGSVFSDCKNDSTSYYDDIMDKMQYESFCSKWLTEMCRICNKVLLYCGTINLPIFYRIKEPLDQIIYFMKFNTIITPTAWAGRYKPLLVYADDKNAFLGRPPGENCKFDTSVIVKTKQYFDVTEKRDRKILVHPCPIDRELIYKILLQMKPKTFLDPFAGSGTTIYMANLLGIKWLAFEKRIQYKHDQDYLMQKSIEKKDKQMVLF